MRFKVQMLQNFSMKSTTMVLAGFFADPIYGGNQGMVGWELIAFNANYWGDDIGLGAMKLMVADTPTDYRLRVLGQFQAEGGGI